MKIPTVIVTTTALALGVLVLPSSSSLAQDKDGRQACVHDAFSICGQFIPNRERVAACLISNRSRVSPACRSALSHFNRHTASAN